jgi:protocatechuate 3,4-dioxygenase beta subunit
MEKQSPAFTPEGTLGPYYPGVFLTQMPQDLSTIAPLLTHKPDGQPIRLTARFIDSAGIPVPSLLVESWQANAVGRYRHPLDRSERPDCPLDPQFDGFARLRTDDNGTVEFSTIKPGAHPVSEGSPLIRAPHLRWTIFASGIDRLITQIFFEGELLNASDPVLNAIPDHEIRRRLIARSKDRNAEKQGVVEYEIDIFMRGERETPFFDDWCE